MPSRDVVPCLVSVADVARQLGFSVRTVKRDCQRGVLPEPIIKRNRWYYTAEDVAAYVKRICAARGRGRITTRPQSQEVIK